jgi:hypothetical protein
MPLERRSSGNARTIRAISASISNSSREEKDCVFELSKPSFFGTSRGSQKGRNDMTEFEQEVESVLGQFCFAFGCGATNARVSHRTIRALQSRYRPYVSANFRTEAGIVAWRTARYHLMHYLTVMGSYAAALASQSGDMTIEPEHFEVAARRFEAAAHRTKDRALTAGPWCPAGDSDGPRPLEPQPEFAGGLRLHSGVR